MLTEFNLVWCNVWICMYVYDLDLVIFIPIADRHCVDVMELNE